MGKIKRQQKSLCEIRFNSQCENSEVIKFRNNRWLRRKSTKYKDLLTNWAAVKRTPLVKSKALKFEVRYFEILPKGYTSLEYHNHAHVVICIKGKGKLRLGNKYKILKYLDIAYIAPNEIHQLLNPYDEPFGFFCIVDAERDKPIEVKI
ncbi:MAG: cupin domain-containing protein [Thermodesulfovibrionaceae bacterium]